MYVVQVNGKPKLSSHSLDRAKLLAQGYLRDGNAVTIRPHDAVGSHIEYFYDPLAVAWMKVEVPQ